MLTAFFRTLILTVIVIASLRIMGKRQIGQLQPSELVVTILLSEIAATPMQDNDIPMLNSIVAICLLVGIEILISALCMKSVKLRTVLQGNSIYVIKDGKLDQKQMKRLRFTIDDIQEALRQKDVFDINEVQYAVAETNGSLSVQLKPEKRPLSVENSGVSVPHNTVPCVVVADSKIIRTEFDLCSMTDEKLNKLLTELDVTPENIFLLTVDSKGKTFLVKKENEI